MLLLVGLGNPGAKYAGNRHNIGFMAVDAIAQLYNFRKWRAVVHGIACEGKVGDINVLLLKPTTQMNGSGIAVVQAKQFFKLSLADITVFHDEIELPFGKVRVKVGGGIAGHNGLRSISEHVGNDYKRVRIGVDHPGVKEMVEYYVLSDFFKSERPWVEALVTILAKNVELLLRSEDASFQNKVHLAMEEQGFDGELDPDSPSRRRSRRK